MRWFIKDAKHPAYVNVTPPEECPQPVLLPLPNNANNTEEPINSKIGNNFEGGIYTFTSGLDPIAETGIYVDSTQFALAIMNHTSPMLPVYEGKYINAGHGLKLENGMPIQFPFGQGAPVLTKKRRVPVSKIECLKHYFCHSLPQLKRGNFILVLNHLCNQIMSYKTWIITYRS